MSDAPGHTLFFKIIVVILTFSRTLNLLVIFQLEKVTDFHLVKRHLHCKSLLLNVSAFDVLKFL